MTTTSISVARNLDLSQKVGISEKKEWRDFGGWDFWQQRWDFWPNLLVTLPMLLFLNLTGNQFLLWEDFDWQIVNDIISDSDIIKIRQITGKITKTAYIRTTNREKYRSKWWKNSRFSSEFPPSFLLRISL